MELSGVECSSLFPDPHFGLYRVQEVSKPVKRKKVKTSADEKSTPVVRTNSRLASCRSRLLMKNITSKPRVSGKQDTQERQTLSENVALCDGRQPSPHNTESPASQRSSKSKIERRSSFNGCGSAASALFDSVIRGEEYIESRGHKQFFDQAVSSLSYLPEKLRLDAWAKANCVRPLSDQQRASMP